MIAAALTVEWGEMTPIPAIDTAAIEARKAAMRKKPAFVGNDMTLGVVAVVAGAIMIFSGDSYFGASFLATSLCSSVKIKPSEVYEAFHAKLGRHTKSWLGV